LVQAEPRDWVNTASLTLLGELRRRAPEAIDWSGMPDIVPIQRVGDDGRLGTGPLRTRSSRKVRVMPCFVAEYLA
jgi:hypothetical protein